MQKNKCENVIYITKKFPTGYPLDLKTSFPNSKHRKTQFWKKRFDTFFRKSHSAEKGAFDLQKYFIQAEIVHESEGGGYPLSK